MLDVVVVGAGPAGLSAALVLGRCRRRVLVCDIDTPRNAVSRALHGYLTRDGIPPLELRRLGREELRSYDSVELQTVQVIDARPSGRGFVVTLEDGVEHSCRKLLIATGVADRLPEIEGLAELYGRSVFHCPYCDGWEVRDQPLAVHGRGESGLGLALELTQWSRQVVLCGDGGQEWTEEHRARLAANGIGLRVERITRLEGSAGVLRRIVFESGAPVECRALFFSAGQVQQSPLAERLGCRLNEKGTVETGDYETTNVRGLFVAGDASRLAQLSIVAAAEGAAAALAINTVLLKEDLK